MKKNWCLAVEQQMNLAKPKRLQRILSSVNVRQNLVTRLNGYNSTNNTKEWDEKRLAKFKSNWKLKKKKMIIRKMFLDFNRTASIGFIIRQTKPKHFIGRKKTISTKIDNRMVSRTHQFCEWNKSRLEDKAF